MYGRIYKRMYSHNYGSVVKVSVLFRSASFIRVYKEIILIKKKYKVEVYVRFIRVKI